MSEGQSGEYASGLELAQSGREHVGRYSEVALEIAVTLWPVEQPIHDKQCPPWTDDVEGRGKVAHAVGWASGFIQNGE